MMAHDDEILTAYLDGELEPQERREVEARLAEQPELRKQLEALRSASKAVQDLPRKKAPASILAAVRGEIARGAEGNGQVIRAGEQFMPGARPSRWRTRLISAAAMLAVGVMIFVAVKASLLQGSKEIAAQPREAPPAAVTQSPQVKEKRAWNKEGKAKDAKNDAPDAREEADSLDRNALADAAKPAAEPPAEDRALNADRLASGRPAEMEQKGGMDGRYRGRGAAEKAQDLAKAGGAPGDGVKELKRGNAAPAEAGAPGGFGGTEGAGAGKPARTLDEAKVTSRDLAAAAKEREGAPEQELETAAAVVPKRAAEPPKPTATPASPPAAPAAKADQKLARPSPPPATNTATGEAVKKLAESGEAQEQLAMANAPDGKPADGVPNLKSESKKVAEAKDQALAIATDAPAKKAAQAAPTVLRMRAGDLGQARAELLTLAAAQGGSELAQDRAADKAQLRREIGGMAEKEGDDAQKAGQRLVAEAMKKAKADEPQAPGGMPEGESANKAGEGEKRVEPSAELAAADRKDPKADAEAGVKRKAQEQEGTTVQNRVTMDPTGQPKVVRLVLQVPASKKAALLAALQQEANRHRAARQSGKQEALGGSGKGMAPESAKQERSKADSSEQPQAQKDERREEARPAEVPAAPAAAAPAEPLEVIEVLIELAP